VLPKAGTLLWEAGSWVGGEAWGGGENLVIREKRLKETTDEKIC